MKTKYIIECKYADEPGTQFKPTGDEFSSMQDAIQKAKKIESNFDYLCVRVIRVELVEDRSIVSLE